MLYTLLCYNDEATTTAWSAEEDAAVMARLDVVHRKYAKNFKPMIRLMPTSTATTLRKSEKIVLDGPYAETTAAKPPSSAVLRTGGSTTSRRVAGGWAVDAISKSSVVARHTPRYLCSNATHASMRS